VSRFEKTEGDDGKTDNKQDPIPRLSAGTFNTPCFSNHRAWQSRPKGEPVDDLFTSFFAN
jgi:hypothetical protein